MASYARELSYHHPARPRGDLRNVAAYIYYDEIDGHRLRYREAMGAAQPIGDIIVQPANRGRILLNSALKNGSKIARDVIRMPPTTWKTLRS